MTISIIFCIRYSRLFSVYLKKHGGNTDNLSIRVYVKKIENRITFKIKRGYNLELLANETIKLLGSTENMISKNRSVENVPYLEIAEVALIHCNIASSDYQYDSRILCTFVPNKPFGNLLEITPTDSVFL